MDQMFLCHFHCTRCSEIHIFDRKKKTEIPVLGAKELDKRTVEASVGNIIESTLKLSEKHHFRHSFLRLKSRGTLMRQIEIAPEASVFPRSGSNLEPVPPQPARKTQDDNSFVRVGEINYRNVEVAGLRVAVFRY